jgi:hypothetical protein
MPIGDCRKIVWMQDKDGMEWWGVRAYNHADLCWQANSREESSTVLFWMETPRSPHYPPTRPPASSQVKPSQELTADQKRLAESTFARFPKETTGQTIEALHAAVSAVLARHDGCERMRKILTAPISDEEWEIHHGYDDTIQKMDRIDVDRFIAARAALSAPQEKHSEHWRNPETGQVECECCCSWALDYDALRRRAREVIRAYEHKHLDDADIVALKNVAEPQEKTQ